MQNAKKQIILNEILFWKKNKMLPEQYCDFLMTLYSEGNQNEIKEDISHSKSLKGKELRRKMLFSIISIIIAIALVVLLFIVTHMTWLIVTVAAVVAFIISAFIIANKNELVTPLLHIAVALLILGLSVKVSVTYFQSNNHVLFALLILNCIIWTFMGLKWKLIYFTLAGVLGIAVIVGYIVL